MTACSRYQKKHLRSTPVRLVEALERMAASAKPSKEATDQPARTTTIVSDPDALTCGNRLPNAVRRGERRAVQRGRGLQSSLPTGRGQFRRQPAFFLGVLAST